MKKDDELQNEVVILKRENTFKSKILIIDGQGRSGKNMISVILSTMPRIEKMRIDTLLDYIPRYYYLNKMSYDAAIVALKIEMDEKLYNNMISRAVNIRFDDYSSIFKSGKTWLYIKRLFQKPEEEAVKRLEKENPIFQNMTHDGLSHLQLYFEAFEERLKFIHVFRDPVGNIYEQNKRNFGTRIGSDPREFQLAYEWKGRTVPLNALGCEEEYLNGNPVERLVLMVDRLFRKNLEGLNKLDDRWKKEIFFIEFEKFAEHPWPYIELLEKYLETEVVSKTRKVMNREKCPRRIDASIRLNRIKDIEKNLSPYYKEIFKNLLKDFDDRPWEKMNSFNNTN
jgi:hypothetical protein